MKPCTEALCFGFSGFSTADPSLKLPACVVFPVQMWSGWSAFLQQMKAEVYFWLILFLKCQFGDQQMWIYAAFRHNCPCAVFGFVSHSPIQLVRTRQWIDIKSTQVTFRCVVWASDWSLFAPPFTVELRHSTFTFGLGCKYFVQLWMRMYFLLSHSIVWLAVSTK